MSTPSAEEVPVALREPINQVSPRAVAFWRVSAALSGGIEAAFLIGAIASTYFIDGLENVRPWVILIAVVLLAGIIARLIWMPPLRFRIHRWEISETAIHTRSGWITREERIAPLSRVQTVDSRQGAVMRRFKLSTITVTTASAAGPIEIACLDEELARQVVADLTEYVGKTDGDAT